jgi:hypothetical protein
VPVPDSLKQRVIMHLTSPRKTEAEKGQWEEDWLKAKFRDLGVLKLVLDTIPPAIRSYGWVNGGNLKNRKSISIATADNWGEIESFNAFLDGNWLLFSRKDNVFTHVFDERTSPGQHELTVRVRDVADNTSERTFRFTK